MAQHGRQTQKGRSPRTWLLLGGGALVVAVAVGVVVAAALSQGGASPPQADVAPSAGHALGPANAPVTVTEYSDFQ